MTSIYQDFSLYAPAFEWVICLQKRWNFKSVQLNQTCGLILEYSFHRNMRKMTQTQILMINHASDKKGKGVFDFPICKGFQTLVQTSSNFLAENNTQQAENADKKKGLERKTLLQKDKQKKD